MKSLIVSVIVTASLLGAPAISLSPGAAGGTAQPASFCNVAPWLPFFCAGR